MCNRTKVSRTMEEFEWMNHANSRNASDADSGEGIDNHPNTLIEFSPDQTSNGPDNNIKPKTSNII